MTAEEFESLILKTAGLLSRDQLEQEFFDSYRPSQGSSQEDVDALVFDFELQFNQEGYILTEQATTGQSKVTTPWSKPHPGATKTVFLSQEALRIVSKFAAKRGLMDANTPGDVIEQILKEYRVEETS